MKKTIRIENLPSVVVSNYGSLNEAIFSASRPFTILFIKPYQPSVRMAHGPAIGILTLISVLKEKFGDCVRPIFRDMKLYGEAPEKVSALIDAHQPDAIAVSALNIEASASYKIARICKQHQPYMLTILGGPISLRQTADIFSASDFDWIFEGAADRTLPVALARHFGGIPLGNDIPGFSYRNERRDITYNNKQDLITDLDSIPMPSWEFHDFETSRKRDKLRIITNLDERPYAYLFTSRGCPYLCNYCHDIFTKRFIYQSNQRVIQEIALLHDQHGVTEFHFVDDIFNLHRPRAQEIMSNIAERWGNNLYIAFPNGLRGDILDQSTIDAMVKAGTYNATISIETVTPRLQALVEKNLDIEKAKWSIEEFDRKGVVVHGSFMFGFPTEKIEEIKNTLNYAIKSPLLHAHFFAVVPHPGTPIFHMAMQESPEATTIITASESGESDYNADISWYQLAYGYPLRRLLFVGMLRFYFHPPRIVKFLRIYGKKAFTGFFMLIFNIAIERFYSLTKKFRIAIKDFKKPPTAPSPPPSSLAP